jgi:hypothetical protein
LPRHEDPGDLVHPAGEGDRHHGHAPPNRLFDILNEGVGKAKTVAEVIAIIGALP